MLLNISTDSLYSANRNRRGAMGRTVVEYLGRKLGGYQIKAIAEYFNRDPVVISQGIRKVEHNIKGAKVFAKKMAKIEEGLINNKSRKILI